MHRYVVFTTYKQGPSPISSSSKIQQLHKALYNSLSFSIITQSNIQQLYISHGGIWMLFTNGNLITYGTNNYGSLGLSYHTVHAIIVHWYKYRIVPHDIITLIEHYSPNTIVPGQILHPIFNSFATKHRIKMICSGSSSHRFLITQHNQMYCVGWNAYHQLGIATKDDYLYKNFNIINYFKQQNIDIVQIECNTTSTIFLTADGHLYICGQDSCWLMSNSKSKNVYTANTPKKVVSLKTRLKKISCGSAHILSLSMNDTLFCGGNNYHGECGIQTHNHVCGFQENVYFSDRKILIKDIACGLSHSVVLDTIGNVYTFGKNEWYQCGNGMKDSVHIPWCVKYLQQININEIQCGSEHTMACTEQNDIYFWGYNRYKQCLLWRKDEYFVKTPYQVLKKFKDMQMIFYLCGDETIIIIST